jgi:hypothetical protein
MSRARAVSLRSLIVILGVCGLALGVYTNATKMDPCRVLLTQLRRDIQNAETISVAYHGDLLDYDGNEFETFVISTPNDLRELSSRRHWKHARDCRPIHGKTGPTKCYALLLKLKGRKVRRVYIREENMRFEGHQATFPGGEVFEVLSRIHATARDDGRVLVVRE